MEKPFIKLWIAVLLLAGVVACDSQESMSMQEMQTWIAAFSSEVVGPDAVLQVVVTDSLFESVDVERSLDGVFSFRPSVKGKARYRQNGRVVEFVPEPGALKPGQAYRCQVSLARLTDQRSFKPFAFDFVVQPQLEELVPEELEPMEIPDGQFKLASAERCDVADPYLLLTFTAPLSPEQDLEGLVTLEGLDKVRFERQGKNVKVFYPANGFQSLVLHVSDLVRSNDGRTLSAEYTQTFVQAAIPPAVEFPMSGSILPDGHHLKLPFQAVNLAAVDVEVVKIYTSNILNFLQTSELTATYGLRRVGRLIHRETLRLDSDPSVDLHRWQTFSLDLKNLFQQEPGAIYNIQLTFRKAYSLYNKSQADPFDPVSGLTADDRAEWDKPNEYIYRSMPDYDYNEYNWRESDDPTKATYYMISSRMAEYNLMASNLGLSVKRGEGDKIWCSVSDLLTTRPLPGIQVTAYNFQLQPIGSGCTNEQGFADFLAQGTPFVVTASDGKSTTYLKMNGQHQLSTSRFQVGGTKVKQGVKGFVYGERGVWRPGDAIHLTLMVEDEQKTLPKNHPVTLEFYTPEEQLYDQQTLTQGVDGIYAFTTRTVAEAPTGQWEARFKVGGQTFRHKVLVETVKPNRLKINITSPEVLRAGETATFGIESHWLTGPAATGLKAQLEWSLLPSPCPFEGYEAYTFQNPLRQSSESKQRIFSPTLDTLGKAICQWKLPSDAQAPGMLYANLIAQVFEAGGDASLTARTVRYSPFQSYVGIALGGKEFETDQDLEFPVVTVDAGGVLVDRPLRYKIYKLDWSWWWEGSSYDLNRYVQSSSRELVTSGEVQTVGGKAVVPFRLDYPSWGKYLIFVEDAVSRHATGGVVFIDWPDWRGRSGKNDPSAATLLSFALDKTSYEAGEYATVYLPKAAGGRVLLSIENGSRVLSRQWVETSATQETAHRLLVTREMAPNFYVHATLLQPHAQTANDLPIRMYGVEGAKVVDRKSVLEPVLEMPDEVLPQQPFTIRVSEANGQPMSYTLAIVDEGLLDLTGFRTPQPWFAMNQREALGVKTWDMYNDVMGAFAGKFSGSLSIGGDEALRRAAGKEKRFNPVVQFLGPFTLSRGSKTHNITLPLYVGSVRVMVVAAKNGAYGSADRTMTVRAPLMLLSTLPRQLSCGERVQLPVNLFVTKEGIGDVEVSVKTQGPLSVAGESTRRVSISQPSETLVDFELTTDPTQSGPAKVIVAARGGGFEATDTVSIQVQNPLPKVYRSQTVVLGGGQTHRFDASDFQQGTGLLTLSPVPAIDFSGAFAFVEAYPHRCSEQLAARTMFLLYARQYLDAAEQERADALIPELLKTLASRQLASGGFVYWPGNDQAHDWVTSMAGEAFDQARRQGFVVPAQVLDRWKSYQQTAARNYRHSVNDGADLVQAYRLYTLALAGEEPSAAMNKLRESQQLSRPALLRLAATYAVVGRSEVALRLLERRDAMPASAGSYATFASSLRDEAMALETWLWVGDRKQAFAKAWELAMAFSPSTSSTQELAFVSAAMSRFVAGASDAGSLTGAPMCSSVAVTAAGRTLELRDLSVMQTLMVDPADGSVTVENQGTQDLGVALLLRRQPAADERVDAVSNGVELTVTYRDVSGQPISIDTLEQGQEFVAQIEVHKRGEDSKSLALTFVAASGWEIWNDRLVANAGLPVATGDAALTGSHQDIRDDRIQWYFPMQAGKQQRFTVRLRAAYVGSFVLPPVVCEDMYDSECRATTTNLQTVVR